MPITLIHCHHVSDFRPRLGPKNGLLYLMVIIDLDDRKVNYWDNAEAESFFKTIKVEWIYYQNFINQEQVQLSIFEWIEGWFDHHRRPSAIG